MGLLSIQLLDTHGAEWRDDFTRGLADWAVEQAPGGSVGAEGGRLILQDREGCTVWYRRKLHAPLEISYRVRARSAGRVSDVNCFWLARDPARAEPLPENAAGRSGRFADYDSLLTYYVGLGGNGNTTTRFRRYDGRGGRPLLAEHDRRDAPSLLTADQWYQIEIRVGSAGELTFLRDGIVLFAWTDPAPLREGWFGFRTVDSHLEISDFEVREHGPAGTESTPPAPR